MDWFCLPALSMQQRAWRDLDERGPESSGEASCEGLPVASHRAQSLRNTLDGQVPRGEPSQSAAFVPNPFSIEGW
jgi:hypothetical protein